ncbi:hypothetical protein U1Q18_006091 [Sarracenia purpurea var. burkii]
MQRRELDGNNADERKESSPPFPTPSTPIHPLTVFPPLVSSSMSRCQRRRPSFPATTVNTVKENNRSVDLLIKAIHHVPAGSAVGIPYIQRRVIGGRRRAQRFNRLIITQLFNEDDDMVDLLNQ